MGACGDRHPEFNTYTKCDFEVVFLSDASTTDDAAATASADAPRAGA
jgi:hypothetical protein